MVQTMVDEAKKRQKLRAKAQRAKLRRQAKSRDVKIAELQGHKPIEKWDVEELARGRPRNPSDGTFRGKAPHWVTREIHEEAVRRFTDLTQADLRGLVPEAIETIGRMILDDRLDSKGRMLVPPSVKLQAAQWVVEHLVGKPTQRLSVDISAKLQAVLANVMVSPDQIGPDGEVQGYKPAITVPVLDAEEEKEDLPDLGT